MRSRTQRGLTLVAGQPKWKLNWSLGGWKKWNWAVIVIRGMQLFIGTLHQDSYHCCQTAQLLNCWHRLDLKKHFAPWSENELNLILTQSIMIHLSSDWHRGDFQLVTTLRTRVTILFPRVTTQRSLTTISLAWRFIWLSVEVNDSSNESKNSSNEE